MSNKDFRVVEVFYSIQGEGARMGVPSIFVRLFGCNFQCQGFGMPRGQLSTEREQIDPARYNRMEDLPLVRTGCDSYVAWDPRFKKFAKWMSVDELATEIAKLLPETGWSNVDLIMTGGEPLLGWQGKYSELFSHPLVAHCRNVTFETNATQILDEELKTNLHWRFGVGNVLFSMSVKLPHSGHQLDEAVNPAAIRSYAPFRQVYKFVVTDELDVEHIEEVHRRVNAEHKYATYIPTYVMPVGGCVDEYNANKRRVAELALKKGWNYSDRMHVSIFGNSWAT